MAIVKGILGRSWVVVIVPVVTLYLSAIGVGLYGTFLVGALVTKAVFHPGGVSVTDVGLGFLSAIDVYLLSMVLYIFAHGLYELFVEKIDSPGWLAIETVDQLKAKLASVVILFVAIAYVKVLVSWKEPLETLQFGIATGILLLALVLYYKAKEQH